MRRRASEREVFRSRSTRRIYSGRLGTICESKSHSLRATARARQGKTKAREAKEGKGTKSRFTSPFQRRLELVEEEDIERHTADNEDGVRMRETRRICAAAYIMPHQTAFPGLKNGGMG